MEMEEKEFRSACYDKTCPAHHVRLLVNSHSDHLTIRCCCDFFTGKYISYVDSKLKGHITADLIALWEKDLLLNELQAG